MGPFLTPRPRSLTALLASAAVVATTAPAAVGAPLDIMAPDAVVTVDTFTPAVAAEVTFDATTSSDPDTPREELSYAWDFGDGTTLSSSTPNTDFHVPHTYTTSGTYTAVLTVSDPEGHSDTDSVDITVGAVPAADLQLDPATAAVLEKVTLDASGTTDGDDDPRDLHYAYSFGDGSDPVEGTGLLTVAHTYQDAGTYTAAVTVTDPSGASSQAEQALTVTNTAPTAAGTAAPTAPHVHELVHFDASTSTDTETPDDLTYAWDFGDGAEGSGAVVEHAYATEGDVTATLTVTDPQGLSDSSTFDLTVVPNAAPTVVLRAGQNQANVGQTVSFSSEGSTDAETPDGLTFSWDFGDGTRPETTPNTTHAFSAPGSYTVALTVTDADGGTAEDTLTMEIGNTAPTASAAATPQPAYAFAEVTFDGSASSDAETPASLTYRWIVPATAGSSCAGGSYAEQPTTTYVFTSSGSYNATLCVRDPLGATDSSTVSVLVLPNRAPLAAGSAAPDPAHVGEAVTFDATGSSDPDDDSLTYTWELPDGSVSHEASVPLVLDEAGSYDATLTVTDARGASDSETVTVEVLNDDPVAAATLVPGESQQGKPTTFDASGSTDTESPEDLDFDWDFGDGNSSSEPIVQHTYLTSGPTTVTLTVTDPQGASDTQVIALDVAPSTAPIARAVVTPRPAHIHDVVTFDASGSTDADGDELTYTWELPDGSTSHDVAPTLALDEVGSYQARLSVSDPYGVTDTLAVPLTVVNDSPEAVARTSARAVLDGTEVLFDGSASTDTETPEDLTYAWDFGDGATSSLVSPTHVFDAGGSYPVTLTVTDPQGRTDVAQRTVTVREVISCHQVARTGSWRDLRNGRAVSGVHCDNRGTGKGVDMMKVRFSGDAYRIRYGTISGGGTAVVTLDGVEVRRISFAGRTKRPAFHWTSFRTTPGSHVLRVKVLNRTGVLDAFAVTGRIRS